MIDNELLKRSTLGALLQQRRDRVQEVLNILLESPYFYVTDHDEAFRFLRRHQYEFAAFFSEFFGWELTIDSKCARLYKSKWFNKAITPANQEVFNFTRRDECIAFMLLLEFFEHKLEVESISVDEAENLRFRFGELLEYTARRFKELYPEKIGEYDEEYLRAKVLRPIMPQLEKYRFLSRIKPPHDERIGEIDTIFEALPALYHYNVSRLSRLSRPVEPQLDGEEEEEGS